MIYIGNKCPFFDAKKEFEKEQNITGTNSKVSGFLLYSFFYLKEKVKLKTNKYVKCD